MAVHIQSLFPFQVRQMDLILGYPGKQRFLQVSIKNILAFEAMPLSDQEISNYKATLSQWMSPQDMEAKLNKIFLSVTKGDQFINPKLGFYIDARTACNLAFQMNAKSVRLIPQAFPDFELTLVENGVDIVRQFEAVEADQHGRKRGDEYRAISDSEISEVQIEEAFLITEDALSSNEEEVIEALQRVCKKKSEKNYPPDTRLVIHVNFDNYYEREAALRIVLAGVQEYKRYFGEIHVLWQHEHFQI
jgi:hypothetical protein